MASGEKLIVALKLLVLTVLIDQADLIVIVLIMKGATIT